MDLNIIWFILIVVLFTGYVILDGFDLGVGMIHYTAENDNERRIMLNSIGPVWDGNEVWLITAGGALFAAFPNVYATVFSGFYTAFMLFLAVLIGRAVSIEFRSKSDSKTWRKTWDTVFNVSSYLIVLLLGVSLGNIVSGVPVDAEMEFRGDLFTLLHPYALLLGLTAVMTLRIHGLVYAGMKTEGALQQKIKSKFMRNYYVFLAFFIALFIWTYASYPHMTDKLNVFGTTVFGVLLVVLFVMIPNMAGRGRFGAAFIGSSALLAVSIVFVAIGIFPNFVISTTDPAYSLNIYNGASSQQTLQTMFIIACIGVPIVLIYSIVVHRIFRGKVKIDEHSY